MGDLTRAHPLAEQIHPSRSGASSGISDQPLEKVVIVALDLLYCELWN
jgi:hypothetical protein